MHFLSYLRGDIKATAMNNLKIALCLIFSAIMLNVQSQDFESNMKYLTQLKADLTEHYDFKEVKLYQTKYLNGKVKYHGIQVMYKEDPENRYWIAGKAFRYFSNGNIKVRANYDIKTNVMIDTCYSYYKSGKPKQIFINPDNSSYTQYPGKVFLKNIWFYNPLNYQVFTTRKNGNKKNEFNRVFYEGGFVYDGIHIHYNRKGEVMFSGNYKNGSKISKEETLAP
jgi:hypothetical protein